MRHMLVVLATLALLVPSFSEAQGRAAGVETAVVDTRMMTETTTVFGQVVAERESAVATRVSGIVVQVPIRVGTSVAAGDVLARMDTELLEIELARAETELAVSEASLAVATAREDRARKALNRAENLRANSTIADAQFEDISGAFAEARGSRQEALARMASARNAIDRARYSVENATVRAPFAGVVLEVMTELGQFAATGSQVARLLDIGTMEVQANVPARLIPGLSAGLNVDGQADTGGALSLRLRAILPTEFSSTRTRPVLFELTSPEPDVAVGQSVTLAVPVGSAREVVVVPKDALVQARGGWSAFVNVDGKAEPRTVRIGTALDDTFEVLSGLAPGDEVVIRGNERLRPGQDIAPSGARPPAPETAPAGAANATQDGVSSSAESREEGAADATVAARTEG